MDEVAGRILDGVMLDPKYDSLTSNLHFNTRFGFLESAFGTLYQDLGRITLVGFGISGGQRGTVAVEGRFESITDMRELKPELRTLERQGKGTGPRLYNTPQALAGTAERPDRVGMYAFTVKQGLIWDRRWFTDTYLEGKFARAVFETGWTRLWAKIIGEQQAVDVINARSNGAEAILRSQTYSAERQKRRERALPSAVPEQFMIIRRPNSVFQKVGEYSH